MSSRVILDYSRKFYIVYKGNYTHIAGLAFNTFLSNARKE